MRFLTVGFRAGMVWAAQWVILRVGAAEVATDLCNVYGGMIVAMTRKEQRAEYITLLAGMLQGQTPATLTTPNYIENLLNVVTAIQTQLDARLREPNGDEG